MKNRYLYSWFSLLLIVSYQQVYAQNELSGKIRDGKDSSAMAGVSVYIPDLKIGAFTDADGKYILHNIPNGTFLIEIYFTGYATQNKEIETEKSTLADFVMWRSSKEFKEVVITGVSAATEQQTSPIPVSVVTQKDMLQNSASNIIDAISMAPGVSQITEGPAISKPVIRGLGYNRVVVVNDGIRQEGQQWGDEFGIELDEYSVHKVEILRGPASLSYGSDAMAGVINMIGAPILPEGKIKGSFMENYQSNNGFFGESLNLAGNIKGLSWDIRYSNKMAHDYQNAYDGYVWNSGMSESNFKAVIGLNRNWGFSHLTFSDFDLKLGIVEGARDSATGKFKTHYHGLGNTDSMGIATLSKSTDYNYFPIIHQHVRHYKAVWDNSIALGDGRLGIRLGFQQNYRQEANDITHGDIFNNYFFLQTFNYDIRYVLPEKNHLEVAFGANGMQQASQDRGLVFLVPEYHLFDLGLFAIAKKSFNTLSVSGGIRYDDRILNGDDLWVDSLGSRLDSKLGPGTNGAMHRFLAYNSSFAGLSGSLGAAYDITKNVYAKLNVARGFRAPTIAESGADGIHDGTPFYEIGDHNLKPESSLQFDATLGLNNEDITIEVTGFVNQINNYIFPEKLHSKLGGDSLRLDPISGLPPGPAFRYVAGDAMLSGGEAVLDIHPHKLSWIRFENSFAMVNAIQRNQPDSTKYLPYTPPYKIRSEVKFIFGGKKLIRNAYAKLGVDYYFKQDKIYYKYGNETVTPDYGLLNIGLGGDIVCKGRAWCSLYIYGANLTDLAYQSNMSRLKYADYNIQNGRSGVFMMGRNISFKLVVPFDVKK
ncbi:MAG: TonB-dependent receptor domain-containing protein [Bacteroidia bacterium]